MEVLKLLPKWELLKAKREAENLPGERTLKEKRREQTVGLRESRGEMRNDAIIFVKLVSQTQGDSGNASDALWVKTLEEGSGG